jgi:hypothetical protein
VRVDAARGRSTAAEPAVRRTAQTRPGRRRLPHRRLLGGDLEDFHYWRAIHDSRQQGSPPSTCPYSLGFTLTDDIVAANRDDPGPCLDPRPRQPTEESATAPGSRRQAGHRPSRTTPVRNSGSTARTTDLVRHPHPRRWRLTAWTQALALTGPTLGTQSRHATISDLIITACNASQRSDHWPEQHQPVPPGVATERGKYAPGFEVHRASRAGASAAWTCRLEPKQSSCGR